MNIGIIVYSQTGNTLKIAQIIKDALASKGHKATIEQVTAEGKIDPNSTVNLSSKPDAAKYDAVVFASPVMAFSLNPVMKSYLPQIKELGGKKAACFVTHAFPLGWMGGNQALKQICELVKAKGAKVAGTAIVHSSGKKEKQVSEAVSALCEVF